MRNRLSIPGMNRRLVLQSDRARARELLLVVLLSIVMLLPVLAYVWQNVEWIQIGYRIERLSNRRDRLVEMRHRLMLEKASLESLSRIEQVSVRQLGLAQPPAGMVVLVDQDRPAPAQDGRSARIASATSGGSRHHVNGADGSPLGTD